MILYNGALILTADKKVIHESLVNEEMFRILEVECSKLPEVMQFSKAGDDRHYYYALFPTDKEPVTVAEMLNRKYDDRINAAVPTGGI